ncbi:MAG: SDR family oxidoreductase [Sediminibacterium sp.]
MVIAAYKYQEKKVVSILGCGWLGLPLALFLEEKGYRVKGSRTSIEGAQQLSAQGIEGYVVSLSKDGIKGDENFWQADILVVNIPPPRHHPEQHVQQVKALVDTLNHYGIKHVLFISSTSVYADVNGVVREDHSGTPGKGSGKALRAAEALLMQQQQFTTTVVRPGGLIGYDRMPLNAAAVSARTRNWDTPMNVIHRDDVIGIVCAIIEQQVWGEVFNACMDEHPTRRAYYIAAAEAIGFAADPPAMDDTMPYKIVNSDKLKSKLQYHFIYPDPLTLFTTR